MSTQSYNFSTTLHGKWLLTGEHAVLRGNPAIVYPIFNKPLVFSYREQDSDITFDYSGEFGKNLKSLFLGVLEHGLGLVKVPLQKARGLFNICNQIPLGAGLGVSAAICAATSQWFAWKQWIEPQAIAEFAQKLENLFHLESSGVDIAGVTANTGVLFQKGQATKPIEQNWKPHWYLSYCNDIGVTAACVQRVKALWHSNQPLAERIDELMAESVQLALRALKEPQELGIKTLAKSIEMGHQCFSQWGLIGDKLGQHIQALLSSGALAAKPTGSGSGGFVLSLWDKPPSETQFDKLTPA